MTKYLQDVRLWVPPGEEAKRWGSFTNFLDTLYVACLPKVRTNDVRGVVVVPCRNLRRACIKLSIRKPDGYQISMPFDFDAFYAAEIHERKHKALKLLHAGVTRVARKLGWEIDPFTQARDEVIRRNFVNFLPWNKPVGSPDRSRSARVWCDYQHDKADLFIVVTRGPKILAKEYAKTVGPGNVWIANAVGKLKWRSKSKVKLWSKNGQQSCEVTIPD